ncbi:MAG: type II toxin-antitoxin system VapC family toxin [Opitutaceae bacterium]
MSLYLETSCLYKLVFPEPETAEVSRLLRLEEQVLVSHLTLFELEQQISTRQLTGNISRAEATRARTLLAGICATPPFVVKATAHDLAQTARRHAAAGPYCRTADRLHLAAMATLGATRLLTNDDTQAAAARALGYGVVVPR